jgi:ParB family transcriptional regulator, chromosome partitioning protein
MLNNNKEIQNKKTNLGRGIGSLIGANSSLLATPATDSKKTNVEPELSLNKSVEDKNRIWNISIDKLVPSPFQARKKFDKEELVELANSIKANGLLQPITARKLSSGAFEIIAGERRWRACQIAGHHTVPVLLKELTDQQALELGIIENIQRSDLNPIEEAEAYLRLMEDFSLTQQQVSEKVGKDRATIANALRLLQLPHAVKELLLDKQISSGHAKALLSLSEKEKISGLASEIVKKGLSVRALEKIIKFENEEIILQSSATEPSPATKAAEIQIKFLEDSLQSSLGTKTKIHYLKGTGKIEIYFYSDDELTKIIDQVKKHV